MALKDDVYLSISFPRIDRRKAIALQKMVLDSSSGESVNIYFDDPIEDVEEEEENGTIP